MARGVTLELDDDGGLLDANPRDSERTKAVILMSNALGKCGYGEPYTVWSYKNGDALIKEFARYAKKRGRR